MDTIVRQRHRALRPFFASLLALVLFCVVASAPARAAEVRVLQFEGSVGPATADWIIRSLEDADAAGAELFVIRMDTPGGLDAAMRDIIKAILESPVPVATWVAPGGSRAASAGTYILYASHIAAMAPATNLGAATPVSIGGGGGGGGSPLPMPGGGGPGENPGDTPGDSSDEGGTSEGGSGDGEGESPAAPVPGSAMERKIINDAVAYIRGLAELRGRNADWAESAVRSGASLSASAALEQNVIDLMAEDLDALLAAVDGREVSLPAGSRTLATADAGVHRGVEPDWRNEFLAIITDPNVAYILLMIGIYGLILEFYNPGVGVAGVTGLICLLLGAYALQMMPVSYAGLGLLGLGIALMITEALSPSFGVFGVGGIIAFIFGSVMLFDTDLPAYQISRPVIAAFAAASAGLFVFAMSAVLRFRRRTPISGEESLMGAPAEAVEDFEDHGRVRLQGEIWQARTTEPLHAGQRLRVTGREGLIVTVTPQADEDAAPAKH
ncbi:MAG: nodulation protein NfeD [Gammaproteobacteria bacterium]|nr:nodulation protein NfeD [Gammaproteobacteria bacterium]